MAQRSEGGEHGRSWGAIPLGDDGAERRRKNGVGRTYIEARRGTEDRLCSLRLTDPLQVGMVQGFVLHIITDT